MQISEATYEQLNTLIQKSFDCNALADNAVYNIDYYRYPIAASITHQAFAHAFPALADEISDLMIKLDARPVRKSVSEYTKDYQDNLEEIYFDLLSMCEAYRYEIIHTIEVAEYNDDYEVKIEMENFLNKFIPYRKQADIWAHEAKRYSDDYKSFDDRFEKFTTFISK